MPDPQPKKERSDAARNRRAILDATDALLAAHGSEHVSIDQIAAAAGVGKGTIFHRFGSRAGLMRELVRERALVLRDAVTDGGPPLGPGAPAPDRLLAYFDAMFRLIVDNVELMIAYDNSTSEAQEDEINVFWARHIAALLAEARPDVDATVLGRLLLGALNPDVILQHIRAGQTERLAHAVHSLVTSVVGEPGRTDRRT
ncbi:MULTISPECIES: TetR family transcriptional regulator [unclassified Rhodococcus (in: high G+C Gram-positive bacteria)]|uniref:TetR/AcrR family transcriptional regulator n=1 Tax=Rhodococcus sp. SJ-3 TaxID=3454628 RepID=UPI003F7A8C0C